MKIVVRVHLVTDWGEVSELDIAQIQRPSGEFESKTLGLSLDDWQADHAPIATNCCDRARSIPCLAGSVC